LALGVPVLQDDSSITDEMHSPDADTAHGNCRGHEQKPVRWLVAGHAGESSSTCQLYAPLVEVRLCNNSNVVMHPNKEVKKDRTM
jgi:hypothetical protein